MTGRLKNNSGYSLVELIIVLGIIAVLSGLAAVTISSISTARASASKESFNEELSNLQTRTKTQDSQFAIQIEKVDGKYNIVYGKSVNGTDFTEDATIDRVILDRVTIYYSADASSTGSELSTPAIIKFNKSDGSVVVGNGVYTFCKEGTTRSVGKVTLNKATGSHYTGS